MATVQQQKDLRQTFGDVGHKAGEQAKDMANEAEKKAKDIGSTMAQKAGEAASYVGEKAEDAACSVGAGIKNLAGTIRQNTPSMFSSAGSAVADTLESGGRYLQDQGIKGIADDMTNVIRRNPIPALLAAIGVGFLIAKATSSRS